MSCNLLYGTNVSISATLLPDDLLQDQAAYIVVVALVFPSWPPPQRVCVTTPNNTRQWQVDKLPDNKNEPHFE